MFSSLRSWMALSPWSWWAKSTGRSTSPWSCTSPQRRNTNEPCETQGSELTQDRLKVHPLFSLSLFLSVFFSLFLLIWSLLVSGSLNNCAALIWFCFLYGFLYGNETRVFHRGWRDIEVLDSSPLFKLTQSLLHVKSFLHQEDCDVAFNKPKY